MNDYNDPSYYTIGERVLIARRREKLTQHDAADMLGIPRGRWKQWEAGENNPVDFPLLVVVDREWCLIMRRRRKFLLRELAQKSGFVAKWLHRAERGELRDITPLVEWWKTQVKT